MTEVIAGQEALSPLALATILLRRRVGILRSALLLAIVVGSAILTQPRHFTSRGSFLPQARRQSAGLSGLAAQFGLAVPTQDGGQSPAFYVDLLLSREILGDAVMTRFPVGVGANRADTLLASYLNAKGTSNAEVRERGILALRDQINASNNSKTGVVNLGVTLRDPRLAAIVTIRLLELLENFNRQNRTSQATAERQFTERRLNEVRVELREAENRQQSFLQRNRDYRNSPVLAFEQERLAREVAMRQQLFTSLAQAYEQSKIEEVRDTPVLSVVEVPEAPPFADGRGLVRYTILAFVLGLTGAAVVFLMLALIQPTPVSVDEFASLRAAWQDAKSDLRRPVSAFFRR